MLADSRKMEIGDLGRYTDAIACLRQTLSEGRKSSHVDIQLMLSNVQTCESIIQQLLLSEQDDFYTMALTSLVGSLSAHSSILSKKIRQLNEACHSPSGHPPRVTGQATPSRSQTPAPTTSQRTGPRLSAQDDGNDCFSTEPLEDRQPGKRQSVIESTIVTSGHTKFVDVVGLPEAKQALQDAIIMPLVFPHLFSGGRKPWKRILLFGPPGTGKSRLACAVSSEVQATFYSVSSTDLISSWVGESEKLIKELFHHASNQPGQAVIFMDEIDSLCRRRSACEDEGTRRVKTELLIQMDSADSRRRDKIFLLCATNCPWDLDTAFLRRFQKRIYIPLPDMPARVQLLKLHCQGHSMRVSEAEWGQLAAQTEGYSGSDLSSLVNEALLRPVRDLQQATRWKQGQDGMWVPSEAHSRNAVKAKLTDFPSDKIRPRDVSLEDFLASLQSHQATVSKEELVKFSNFTTCSGQSG